MKRATLYQIVKIFLRTFTRTTYVNPQNVPAQGGVLIATNHLSQLDTPVLMLNSARPDITALVTDKYQKFWFMRWFVNSAEGIWIDRTKADFTAFRAAIDALRSGRAVGIAPEGTRSLNGGLLQGKPGMILLSVKADVPIVPVGISGTEHGFDKIFSLRWPKIQVKFGRPFRLPPLSRENREEAMQQQTDEIMCHIAAQLPPEYRGYYANHPRVAEILAEEAGLNESETRVRV